MNHHLGRLKSGVKEAANWVWAQSKKYRFIAADVLKSLQDRMSEITLNVALPNGHAELLRFLPSSTVQDVRTKAQQTFGKKYLKLITAKNRVLVDFEQTLEEAEIEDRECLTALVLQPKLAATRAPTGGAFALWCHGDSTIVTWGDADCGGDSSADRDHLKGVVQIQATFFAFAAILEDGSVVTWGHAKHGGDSSAVRDELKGVVQIQSTGRAFAAILEDGSVITWGDAYSGGDSLAVRDQLKGVLQIQATEKAFAAILEDGSVVTWGNADGGGYSSAVQDQLKGVQQIQATRGFCCDFGRWIRRYLGIWGWLFGSSRSAQGCPADSSHSDGLCGHSGRWISPSVG